MNRLLSFLFAFWCLFSDAPVSGASGRWIMNTNLNLDAQDSGLNYFWNWYNGADAPNGSWFGWMSYDNSVRTNIFANVQTGVTNAPGTYFVFLKTFEYFPGTNCIVSLGDGTGVSGIPTYTDWNSEWGNPIQVTTTTSFTNILFEFLKPGFNSTNIANVTFEGLYYTTNAFEDFSTSGADSVLVYQISASTNSADAIAGNWLEDASFENWPSHGWLLQCYGTSPAGTNSGVYHQDYPIAAVASSTTSFHGGKSLHITEGSSIFSRIIKLRADRTYTLSLAMKRPNSTTTVDVNLYAIPSVPPNKTPSTNIFMRLTAAAESSTNWVRYSTNRILWKYPGEYFQLKIDCGLGDHQENPTDVFIDAVQLQEGGLTDFAPRYDSEFGLSTTNVVNVFTNGSPVIQVTGFHNGAGSTIPLMFEVFDFLNQRVTNGTMSITCGASNLFTNVLFLATVTQNGSYRMVAWASGAPDYRDELTFSVMPTPAMEIGNTLGLHSEFLVYHARMLNHVGIKFSRSLSPGLEFRWNVVEPTEGAFVWNDNVVNMLSTNNVKILASMGLDNKWPTWANDAGSGYFLLPAYSNWVYQVVNHYKTLIEYWEFWNEPQYTFNTTFLALMHSNFVYAVRAADATAKIVGIGGDYSTVTATNTWNQLDSDVTSKIDFISYHIYPAAYSGEIMNLNENFKYWAKGFAFAGKPLWNTETGSKDRHFGFTEVLGFDPQGSYYDAYYQAVRYWNTKATVETVLINYLRSVGTGATKYFYYDGRVPNETGQLVEFTGFEFDDSIRPKLFALVLANQFLGQCRGQGDITNAANSNIESYILTNLAGSTIALLWSRDNTNRFITITNNGTTCLQYDAMCNPVTFTNSRVYLSRMPTYLASTMGLHAMSNTVCYATSTNIADSLAPLVSIDKSPNGTITTNNFPLCFKWMGIDDTFTESVEYSYKLVGRDSDFSTYAPDIYMEVPTVEVGTYRLDVKAKDAVGNESAVMSGPEFTFGMTDGVTNSSRQTSRRGLFLR